MADKGRITSKNRGRARLVRTRKALPAAPALMTISRNLSDCVRKITNTSVIAMKIVAMDRFFRR